MTNHTPPNATQNCPCDSCGHEWVACRGEVACEAFYLYTALRPWMVAEKEPTALMYEKVWEEEQ